MNKSEIIKDVLLSISKEKETEGKEILKAQYAFKPFTVYKRNYSTKMKMQQFIADGFVDRYSGDKLVNPGVLRVLSYYYPDIFPYQAHWKTTETHIAYWELSPTIDHIVPISFGGADSKENWATTSMMNNLIKNNWSLEQLRWSLYPKGNIRDWDGLTRLFVEMVDKNSSLLDDQYIKTWYRASVSALTKL